MQRKIGIFGGSFDPIHLGHLDLMKLALSKISLDKLIIIPAGAAPHKSGSFFDARLRLKMVRESVKELADSRISVSNWEIKQAKLTGKKSYTVQTMRYFQQLYPQDQLYLILGTDMMADLANWKQSEEIVAGMKIVMVNRAESVPLNPKELRYQPDIIITDSPINVSSTEIRRRLQTGGNLENLVPKSIIPLLQNNRRKIN